MRVWEWNAPTRDCEFASRATASMRLSCMPWRLAMVANVLDSTKSSFQHDLAYTLVMLSVE